MRVQVTKLGEIRDTPIGPARVLDYQIVEHRKKTGNSIYVRYLYEDFLDLLAEDMRKNVQEGYDNIVCIEGPEGSGKSNAAYQLISRYEPHVDLQKVYVYDTDAFKDKLESGDDIGKTFWMDEGSNIANNRDWNTENNKNLVKIVETMRSRHWTLQFCIPTVERLDIYLRENRLRYLITCEPMEFKEFGYKKRGYCEIKKRDDYGQLKSIGYAMYDPMPPKISIEYEKIKSDSQKLMIQEMLTGKSKKAQAGAKYKEKYETISKGQDAIMYQLHASKAVSDEELMRMYGIDNAQTFRNRLSKGKKHLLGGRADAEGESRGSPE